MRHDIDALEPLTRFRTLTIVSIISICTAVALRAASIGLAADSSQAFEFRNTDVTIFSPETNRIIGYGHYRVLSVGRRERIRGENEFLNGEHDVEVEHLEKPGDGSPPALIDYEHVFFKANGSPQFTDSLEVRSGTSSCQRFGPEIGVRESKLVVPPDIYAGATQLMLIIGRLRQGFRSIEFHAFNCAPGPQVFAIHASLSRSRKLPMFSADFARLEIAPDLGWLNYLAAPFTPKMFAWFDRNNNWDYVGAEFDRFYKGPHILVVRVPP